jgi:shikimate dehydrogenase
MVETGCEPFDKPVDANTRCCAVFGHPVRHSASPAMQNAGLAALGLNWRYMAFEVSPPNLPAALEGARAMGYIGVNLTVPHKLAAVSLVDSLDETARTWGAVNTVRFETEDEAGEWRGIGALQGKPANLRARGFNTDADAILRALKEDLGFSAAGARVLIVGAGGAGRTAALKLASEGVDELFIVNRTRSKAEALEQEIRGLHNRVRVGTGYPSTGVDLLLNATSLGLKAQDPLPLDEAAFPLRKANAVYDMIYRPADTPLLQAAKAAGCRVANGLGMLLYQGVKALEIWTERAAPVEVMRHALERSVYGG